MRIVFMGTPSIAAACLRRIHEDGCDIVGVYTKPDTPKNRGMKLSVSEVKAYAQTVGLPVFQPPHFKERETIEQLRALRPDLIAVVAYGRILPRTVLELPTKGCINIHASLLPALRGSGPAQWAILNGLDETGVTAMYLAEEMDAGDMIEARRTPIDPMETSAELLERLAEIGAALLSDTVRSITAGTAARTPQDHTRATYAPMLTKAMAPVDWTGTPRQIVDHVRGLIPWPVATAELAGKRFKLHRVEYTDKTTDHAPGTLLALDKHGLEIACGGGAVVRIAQLQAEGGKRMAAADYFRGHPIQL